MQRGDLVEPKGVAAAGGAVEALKRAAAARAFRLLADGEATPPDVRAALERLADDEGVPRGELLLAVLDRALGCPELRRLAPRIGVGAALRLLAACGGFAAAAVWVSPAGGSSTSCFAVVGGHDETAAVPMVVPYRATTLRRFGRSAGVLLTAGGPLEDAVADVYLADAVAAIERLLERDLLLERSADRERAVTASMERRLTRLAYDLHDGPLQDLAALAADAALLRRQIATLLDGDDAVLVGGRFDDLQARLEVLDEELRATLDTARGAGSSVGALERALMQELATFRRITDINVDLELDGDFDAQTDSRRIAVFRVVQEALSNVRDHSDARSVRVRVAESGGRIEVSVTDDGRGFDVAEALTAALGGNRFGLTGMHERVRLLGGELDVRSTADGGTHVSFSLDAWRPLGADGAGTPEVLV